MIREYKNASNSPHKADALSLHDSGVKTPFESKVCLKSPGLRPAQGPAIDT